MPLRTALAISFSLHLLLVAPWSALYFNKIEDKEEQIEVTYILEELVKEEFEKEIANLPQKYDLEKKEITQARIPPLEEEYIEEAKAEQIEEYIAYYDLIREKIKQYVTRYYQRSREGGRAEAIFTLNKQGRMRSLAIDVVAGSDRAYLEKTARRSIKSASPFPPFPEALRKDELTFTIAIIFKKG